RPRPRVSDAAAPEGPARQPRPSHREDRPWPPAGGLFFVERAGLALAPRLVLRHNGSDIPGTIMAKLYFSYAAMNAGKSTLLLQAAYNYRERGMRPLLYTSALYAGDSRGAISSRIGIAEPAA